MTTSLPVSQHIPLSTHLAPTYLPQSLTWGSLSRSPGNLTLCCLAPWPLGESWRRPVQEGRRDRRRKPRFWSPFSRHLLSSAPGPVPASPSCPTLRSKALWWARSTSLTVKLTWSSPGGGGGVLLVINLLAGGERDLVFSPEGLSLPHPAPTQGKVSVGALRSSFCLVSPGRAAPDAGWGGRGKESPAAPHKGPIVGSPDGWGLAPIQFSVM